MVISFSLLKILDSFDNKVHIQIELISINIQIITHELEERAIKEEIMTNNIRPHKIFNFEKIKF